MIILRNKIVEEKLFAETSRADDLDKISTFNDRICVEIMKMMEMYDLNNGQHLYHWMRNLVKSFFKDILNTKFIMYSKKIPQVAFIKADPKNAEKQIGQDFVSKYITMTPIDYIEFLKKFLLSMRDSDGIKYDDAIRNNGGFIYSNEDYIAFYKYIGLCLSGQLNYENTDFWSDINQIERLNIDYSRSSLNSNELHLEKVIGNCLFQLKYNIPDGSNIILKYI